MCLCMFYTVIDQKCMIEHMIEIILLVFQLIPTCVVGGGEGKSFANIQSRL